MPGACKVARTIRAVGFMKKNRGGMHGSGEDAMHPFRVHGFDAWNAPTQDGANVRHGFQIRHGRYNDLSVMVVVPVPEEATCR